MKNITKRKTMNEELTNETLDSEKSSEEMNDFRFIGSLQEFEKYIPELLKKLNIKIDK